jgi:hypothetical protein
MSRKLINKSPDELRPHPLNKELYGAPTANTAYKEIRADMMQRGYDERWPLLITEGGLIIWGITRCAVARSLNVKTVPCQVFEPDSTTEAEIEQEIERELIRGNVGRRKTQLMIAREQRKVLELEREFARRRMASGADGGPSKASDRVGRIFSESGKTVQHRLKILKAIETAEEQGDRKRADTLTQLLEAKSTVKALNLIAGKAPKPAKPPKVEVPRTLNDHATKAYGEFFEACAKAQVPAEVELLKATLGRMGDDLNAARKRIGK